jgi:hypothetical protein
MRLSPSRLGIVAACIMLLLACSDGFPPEFPAADFSLKSPQTDKEIRLADVKGRPVIIYWFTSW